MFKSPANEVVLSATDLERRLTKGQQDVLNPEGVNCLRFFEGRGNLVWGARTISDDPEWKYVIVRRYFAYLEHSIERGTQWVVFESNGDALWANVRRTIEDFLFDEWKSGALLGTEPKQAFFVRCDRSTMTPERSRQRAAGVPDRRGGGEARRVRDLPHRPVDRVVHVMTDPSALPRLTRRRS